MHPSTGIVIFLSAVFACSMAAPAVLSRNSREAPMLPTEAQLMGLMRSGLRVLAEFSKYNLSTTLNVSTSEDIFDFSTTVSSHKELQEALNTTCKLHEAQNTLAKFTLEDETAYDILTIMSNKSLEDACKWTTTTLGTSFGSSYHVHCDNSSLTDLCRQWNDVVAINKVETKVDNLRASISDTGSERDVNETKWINRQNFDSSFEFLKEIYNCAPSPDNSDILRC